MHNKTLWGPLVIWISLGLSACPQDQPKTTETAPQGVAGSTWRLPNPAKLSQAPNQAEIQKGEEILRFTPRLLGPDAPAGKQFAGNRLACSNCHLNAGQQPHALGFVGITHDFPQYRARENRQISLEERINGCFERSLNGRALPEKSPEMQALIAYMRWLSSEVPPGQKVKERGIPKLPLLKRAADPQKGQQVYTARCQNCHQANGLGLAQNPQAPEQGYTFPPVWGNDSFNTGAGMHRLITAAQFIKANMPLGQANLTDEEAFDVAAYLHSQPRPVKGGLEGDFPDRSRKPVDAPFGPYLDSFSQRQHEYGPYPPIVAFYEQLKATSSKP
ncbi:MAG: c-type cytochrome [Candidatus Sericytochromatia bacterium]